MKIECHIIQNFPPHCLNRDDTNAPKDCEFGGVRRARISSQCLKRAVREAFKVNRWLPEERLAIRTKRLVHETAELLVAKGRSKSDAAVASTALLLGASIRTEKPKDESEAARKTEYLLFLPQHKVEHLAALVDGNWEVLLAAVQTMADQEGDGQAKDQKGKKKPKKSQGVELPKEVRAAAQTLLKDAEETPEIALFGRMIADNPDWNVEAACQVAHAISTHRVAMDFDFFTAIDDVKGDKETGSDMMGTIQFNSSCFYRYAVLDTEALRENLGGDTQAELANKAVEAFLKGFVCARPSGKQNSMAAHTPPSLVFVTVRTDGAPVSLANAFVKPIVPDAKKDLVTNSIAALKAHFSKLQRMYPGGLEAAFACSLDGESWDMPIVETTASVDELIDRALSRLPPRVKAA